MKECVFPHLIFKKILFPHLIYIFFACAGYIISIFPLCRVLNPSHSFLIQIIFCLIYCIMNKLPTRKTYCNNLIKLELHPF